MKKTPGAIAAAVVVAGGVTTGLIVTSGPTAYSPPSSISTTCSVGATAALNTFFAGLPKNATVNLPQGACYAVSNTPTSLFAIEHTQDLTINGNGATFHQRLYAPAGDPKSPVLTLGGNLGLTINNLTLSGPSSSGGGNVEGDIGLLMWQNWAVSLSGITIQNVEGDGLDVYPHGNLPGVNWYVTLNNSTIRNVGYHGIVPEAADGFYVTNSTISGDIDAEVDFNCENDLPNCGTLAQPSIGVENMTFSNDTFPSGLRLEDGMSCMPIGNWTIKDNNLESGGMDLQFDTTYSLKLQALLACGQSSGLTITGNSSTATSQHPCCGSGSPYIVLQGWSDVTISGNHLVFTPSKSPLVDLWSDSNVSIANNTISGLTQIKTSNAPAGWPANVNVK